MTFHPTRQKDPIYTLEARDTAGDVILQETFDPHYVIRPFFDLFPEYEQIRVTTGWITASSGAETLVDQRIATDPERFWDRLQTETSGRSSLTSWIPRTEILRATTLPSSTIRGGSPPQ